MSLRPRTLGVLTVLLFLVVAGCRPASQQPAAPTSQNPDTLTVVRFGDPETLDPAYAYDTASAEIILWNVYETLLFFKGESTSTFVPMLATDVPTAGNGGISRDGLTYTFIIREGVKFHDGSALTAEDVKYSLMRFMFMDRDGGPSWVLLEPILGVSGTRDDSGKLNAALFDQADQAIQVQGNQISITLNKPFAPFLAIMAQWSMVTSRQWSVGRGDWDGSKAGLGAMNNPADPSGTKLFSAGIGTGPFKIASWDRQNRQVVLERHDAYWRDPAKLARVVIRVIEEFGPRKLMLEQGDADIITVNRPEQTQVEGLRGVRIADDIPQLSNVGIFMNLNIKATAGTPDIGTGALDGNGIPADFFADVNVRRGVAHAIDYGAATRDCYRGKAQVGHGPIPRGLFGYDEERDWYEFDTGKAAASFREAQGGRIWEVGFKFTVLFNRGNAARQCLAQVIKSGLELLNPKFTVDVRGVTWAQYLSLYRDGKLPIWIIGWAADYPDPDNFVSPYMHSTGTYASAQSYTNPQVDQLIEQARTATDQRQRARIYEQLAEIALNDVFTIWLDPVALAVMRDWVRGWYSNPTFPGLYMYPISKS